MGRPLTNWTANTGGFSMMDVDDQARRHRDRAPGLDGVTLDNLLRDAWVAGHAAGHLEGREEGFRDGLWEGNLNGGRKVRHAVSGVLNTVYWISRRLDEREGKKRTTIKAERDFIATEADNARTFWARLKEISGDA